MESAGFEMKYMQPKVEKPEIQSSGAPMAYNTVGKGQVKYYSKERFRDVRRGRWNRYRPSGGPSREMEKYGKIRQTGEQLN